VQLCTDLRHFRRWTRNTPVEVLTALQLGEPPGFDGVKCTDCGRRFRNEKEHSEPHVAGGLASTRQSEMAVLWVPSEQRIGKKESSTPPNPECRAGTAGVTA
jgi:hypothetical protein